LQNTNEFFWRHFIFYFESIISQTMCNVTTLKVIRFTLFVINLENNILQKEVFQGKKVIIPPICS